jgi:hypothetical protein
MTCIGCFAGFASIIFIPHCYYFCSRVSFTAVVTFVSKSVTCIVTSTHNSTCSTMVPDIIALGLVAATTPLALPFYNRPKSLILKPTYLLAIHNVGHH